VSKSSYTPQIWEPLPAGWHVLTLKAVSDQMGKGFNNSSPQPQKKLTWVSDIVGPNGEPLRINQWTNDSFHPKSKLRAVATALNGGRDPGDAIDWDTYVGRSAEVLIKHVTNETGHVWPRVIEVRRAPTPAELAEAERVRAATEKVKAATQPPPAGNPPQRDAMEITNDDIPF
jgi:hypothetical protein